ncbi:MAG: hypothetical protein IKO44_02260 [Ruminococcus sp.]|nr:hypothetical protein [Ruminococcus sp.]
MDKQRFEEACKAVADEERSRSSIGTLSEKSVHAVLKRYFEPDASRHEIPVGGFVADIVSENGIIEIQTRQFSRLLNKLEQFLEYSRVTVVYPISKVRHITRIDPLTGETLSRRKSPKKGCIYDIIPELYRIKYTLDNPRLDVCICMLETEDIRTPEVSRRNKGASKLDCFPADLLEEIWLEKPEDYRMFLPEGLNEEFTSADLAKSAAIPRSIAQTALNLLAYLGLVEKTGKGKRNTIIYRIKN